jgi:hypothetical protein
MIICTNMDIAKSKFSSICFFERKGESSLLTYIRQLPTRQPKHDLALMMHCAEEVAICLKPGVYKINLVFNIEIVG